MKIKIFNQKEWLRTRHQARPFEARKSAHAPHAARKAKVFGKYGTYTMTDLMINKRNVKMTHQVLHTDEIQLDSEIDIDDPL